MLFLLALSLVSAWLVFRILYVAWQIRNSRKLSCKSSTLSLFGKRNAKYPLKTMVVLGSGGHTTEMLNMIAPLDPEYYHPVVFVKAKSDTTSVLRLPTKFLLADVLDIPRSREVGQSYMSSIATTLNALAACVGFILEQRPNLILANGPGTCLPICVAALGLGRILGLFDCTAIVFVESFCRVKTLSLTGKIMYWMADLFVVHWDELRQAYPSSALCTQFVADEEPAQNKKEH